MCASAGPSGTGCSWRPVNRSMRCMSTPRAPTSVRYMRRAIFLIPILLLAQSRSMWEGVSTKAQIAKGQKVYREECQRCHGENMLGGEDSPALVGDALLEKWYGKTVGDLFERTRKTMPTDG